MIVSATMSLYSAIDLPSSMSTAWPARKMLVKLGAYGGAITASKCDSV